MQAKEHWERKWFWLPALLSLAAFCLSYQSYRVAKAVADASLEPKVFVTNVRLVKSQLLKEKPFISYSVENRGAVGVRNLDLAVCATFTRTKLRPCSTATGHRSLGAGESVQMSTLLQTFPDLSPSLSEVLKGENGVDLEIHAAFDYDKDRHSYVCSEFFYNPNTIQFESQNRCQLLNHGDI